MGLLGCVLGECTKGGGTGSQFEQHIHYTTMSIIIIIALHILQWQSVSGQTLKRSMKWLPNTTTRHNNPDRSNGVSGKWCKHTIRMHHYPVGGHSIAIIQLCASGPSSEWPECIEHWAQSMFVSTWCGTFFCASTGVAI